MVKYCYFILWLFWCFLFNYVFVWIILLKQASLINLLACFKPSFVIFFYAMYIELLDISLNWIYFAVCKASEMYLNFKTLSFDFVF